jgi:hypothetical protein
MSITFMAVPGFSYSSTGEMYGTGTDAGGNAGVWKRTTGSWTRIDGDNPLTVTNADTVPAGNGLVSGPGISGVDMVYAADSSAAGQGVSRIKANRTVAEQLADSGTTMGLWYQPGSNVLYTIDANAAPDRIRTYTDTLNVAGSGVVVSGITAAGAAISWDALANAATYKLTVKTGSQATNVYTAANTNTGTGLAFTFAGASNTTYSVSVWAASAASGAVTSFLFSGATSFTTLPAPPVAPPPNLLPFNGAVNQPINDLAFGWAVPGTGALSYNWALSTDPTFASITEGSQNTTATLLVWAGPLTYDTSYFWRVQSVGITGPSAWVTSVFTTVAEPAPVVTVPPAPTPIITLLPPQVTVVPPAITVIPPDIIIPTQAPPTIVLPEADTPVYIWVIIGIGAILVIAVIVLVVRTRRVV